MKLLSNAVGSDGNRAAVVGYGPERRSTEGGGSFGIEIKVDPGVLKRPTPRLLNYDVMQPLVDSLSFVQVSAKGKVIEIFSRVQNAGGSTLIGDASYVDVESPRGVPVRMVPRKDREPAVELISFNVEVPAFEPTVKFYKRAMDFKPLKYSSSEPPVQKLSVFLGSDAGGPNLLLSPVPDGRLKNRATDEFEGVLVVAPSASEVAKAASEAIELAAKEEALKDELIKGKLLAAKQAGEDDPTYRRLKTATRAKPSVEMTDTVARIDDGLGNILYVSDYANFERALA